MIGGSMSECTCPALNGQPHICEAALQDNGRPTFVAPEPKDKGGRPKGYDGRKSKMPSAMAQAFKRMGLNWYEDFAVSIKRASDYNLTKVERAEAKDRIALWLRLLPYLITSSARSKGKKYKGGPSKAALIALEALEGR